MNFTDHQEHNTWEMLQIFPVDHTLWNAFYAVDGWFISAHPVHLLALCRKTTTTYNASTNMPCLEHEHMPLVVTDIFPVSQNKHNQWVPMPSLEYKAQYVGCGPLTIEQWKENQGTWTVTLEKNTERR
jgi:hypothetical protein